MYILILQETTINNKYDDVSPSLSVSLMIRMHCIFCKCTLFFVNKSIALSRVLTKCMSFHKSCRASRDVNVNCIPPYTYKNIFVRGDIYATRRYKFYLLAYLLASERVYQNFQFFSINLHIHYRHIVAKIITLLCKFVFHHLQRNWSQLDQ